MSQPLIDLQIENAVATVWLNRPELHNAFNAELINQLIQCFHDLKNNQQVRVVVLAGHGKSFSAGADLNWMKAAGEASYAENVQDAERLALMLHLLKNLPQPTIAKVQGAALGGGMGLASVCDICIASERAIFATSEVRLGLAPSTISPYVIAAIGQRQASRYFLTAERISAQQALSIGLVHEVCEHDDLDACVVEMINHILKGASQAQTASKELIQRVANQEVTEELRLKTSQHIAHLRQGQEAKEGLVAFLEKRPANWCQEY